MSFFNFLSANLSFLKLGLKFFMTNFLFVKNKLNPFFSNLQFSQIITSKKAFSLVEILVTVALIAIVASIGTIKFQSFVRQGKVTEAKLSLAQVYLKQKTFHLNKRFYHANLKCIRLNLEGEYVYNIGFASTDTAKFTTTYLDNKGYSSNQECYKPDNNKSSQTICGNTFSSGSKKCAIKASGRYNLPCGATGQGALAEDTFEALACADLGGSQKDIWIINQRKQTLHHKDGTK